MLTDQEIEIINEEQKMINEEKQQLNEVAPLLAFLFGIFAKAGYDREKARRAAEAAAGAAEQQAPGASNAVNQQGQPQRPTGILKNGRIIRTGDMVKELQTYLGFQGADIDGKFGPKTERAVRTFQQNSGIKVDGIVGPNTIQKIRQYSQSGNTPAPNPRPAPRDGGIPQGTTTGGPSQLRQRSAGLLDSIEETNMSESINEEITITGDPESLLRMMQLAGADGAKEVDADDINQSPETCPICGKMHGPSQPMGGCGSKPKEPGMGDMIKLMAPEEDMAEEEGPMGDEYDDEPSAPDEEYANDVSASMPAGDDLHKKKKAYPAVDGGDNPMTAENLEAKIKEYLSK